MSALLSPSSPPPSAASSRSTPPTAILKLPEYQHALVFVAWEHLLLDKFAQMMVKSYGGDPAQVPPWTEDDYDTIFVLRITHQNGHDTVDFSVDHEGLNNLGDSCP
jgi:hypothetical protein